MSEFFDRLMADTQGERDALLATPFIQHGWRGELSLDSYRAFLGQAYHHVKHTTPLLMACGSRVPHDKASEEPLGSLGAPDAQRWT